MFGNEMIIKTFIDARKDFATEFLAEIEREGYETMADAGVMPSVGMECLINFPDIDNAWYEYTIDFMGKHVFIASCKDVSERFGHIEDVHIKPLTPPIELIDGKAYQFDYKFDKYTGIYSDIDNNHKADIFIIIDGHVMSSYCTNIQLLEVKS